VVPGGQALSPPHRAKTALWGPCDPRSRLPDPLDRFRLPAGAVRSCIEDRLPTGESPRPTPPAAAPSDPVTRIPATTVSHPRAPSRLDPSALRTAGLRSRLTPSHHARTSAVRPGERRPGSCRAPSRSTRTDEQLAAGAIARHRHGATISEPLPATRARPRGCCRHQATPDEPQVRRTREG
jgi:hypothetical protein